MVAGGKEMLLVVEFSRNCHSGCRNYREYSEFIVCFENSCGFCNRGFNDVGNQVA